jgi:hypothetical protein
MYVALAAQLAAMGPYTTFQQLRFAPPFPMETLAEECMIPPTYKSLLAYKAVYESAPVSNQDNDEEPSSAPSATFPVNVVIGLNFPNYANNQTAAKKTQGRPNSTSKTKKNL